MSKLVGIGEAYWTIFCKVLLFGNFSNFAAIASRLRLHFRWEIFVSTVRGRFVGDASETGEGDRHRLMASRTSSGISGDSSISF